MIESNANKKGSVFYLTKNCRGLRTVGLVSWSPNIREVGAEDVGILSRG